MSNQVCNDTGYLNSVDQKKRFQLLNIPPVRYNNLANNPYQTINPSTGLNYTKTDLDMRRKAEILQYSSNRMSTQTNNLTKAQKYAQAINGSYQQRTYPQSFIIANTVNNVVNLCPRGVIIKTSTTASDVPGTPMLLYDDPTVPLYNLLNTANRNAYGVINQPLNPYITPYDYIRLPSIYVLYLNASLIQPQNTFTSIYILKVDVPNYIFSISTPISFNLSGTYLSQNSSTIFANALQISIFQTNINVKYSYSDMTLSSATTVSLFNQQTINVDVDLRTAAAFNASCYLGTLNINNLKLPVEKGFIYDIQVSIIYEVIQSIEYTNNCVSPTITTVLNSKLSDVYPPLQNNCTLTGAAAVNPSNFPYLYVSGIPSNE
jgi:hypothetical protein